MSSLSGLRTMVKARASHKAMAQIVEVIMSTLAYAGMRRSGQSYSRVLKSRSEISCLQMRLPTPTVASAQDHAPASVESLLRNR